jgi:protease-4
MRRILFPLLAIFIFFAALGFSQGLPDYYSRYQFLIGSPAAYGDGLVGFVNPANLAFLKTIELDYYWMNKDQNDSEWEDWGIFSGTRGLGFGFQSLEIGGDKVVDYRLSTAFGGGDFAFGLGYGWSSGNHNAMGRQRLLTAGSIMRPWRYLSIGAIGAYSLESAEKEWVFDIGIRPLGNARLTLFGDISLMSDISLSGAPKSAGAAIEIVRGVSVVGRYFKSEAFTLGLCVNFGHGGATAQGYFNSNGDYYQSIYSLRLGEMRPSVLTAMGQKRKRYLSLNMKGTVDYQKYVLFDNDKLRLYDILKNIKAAADDPRVGAIAMNLSGMEILPEHAWEIRQELKKFRDSGKKTIIFFDRAGMTGYHLASVADKIVLDPEGFIQLEGYVLGKTYFKGTLAKLGLGYDEWRFFKYKSAAEVLSRDKMSDADREQYQYYVDDLYESVRADICEGRGLSIAQYDKIIDDEIFILPEKALELKLADTLGRWSDAGKIINSFSGAKMSGIAPRFLMGNALASDAWGETPKIAVVYGLGECAMDSGIKGRWLENLFLKLRDNRSVKAVVFRVDSPGGDALPSDLVANAMKKCGEKKPVIVSQGQVAGSGGYWISMYGDTILAGPNTVTGSIGVIGGWIYDKGLGDKLGMTSDYVKRGAHAEVGFGITVPIIGLRAPARNLTRDEREKIEVIINKFYDSFVKKVAVGRNMTEEQVRKIGEGRFYSGLDGKEIGLVDEIGGLMEAIAIAKHKAGLLPGDECEIIEVPKYKALFEFPKLLPISTVADEPAYRYIKLLLENPGKPLPMLVPGTYPTLK